MRYEHDLYKNQGIHTITAIFTVSESDFSVLLIKRDGEPFAGIYSLVGGSVYNNEDLDEATKREILEKTGLTDVNYHFFKVYSDPHRAPKMRMLACCYIGIVPHKKIEEVMLKTKGTNMRMKLFKLNEVPELAFDHNKILSGAVQYLKEVVVKTDILKSLFQESFTLPQLQKTYEKILDIKIDRRNFRKNILNLGIIEDLNKLEEGTKTRPGKLYKFKKNIKENKKLF